MIKFNLPDKAKTLKNHALQHYAALNLKKHQAVFINKLKSRQPLRNQNRRQFGKPSCFARALILSNTQALCPISGNPADSGAHHSPTHTPNQYSFLFQNICYIPKKSHKNSLDATKLLSKPTSIPFYCSIRSSGIPLKTLATSSI